MNDSSSSATIRYVGAEQIIITSATRASIIHKDGEKIRYLNLDLSKRGEAPINVISAGLGIKTETYWFTTGEEILLLHKGEDKNWRWLVSKLKIAVVGQAPTESVPYQSLAMVVDIGEDKQIKIIGSPMALNKGKLYRQLPRSQMVNDLQAATIQITFTTEIQPIIGAKCAGCHPGYDAFEMAQKNGAAYKSRINSGDINIRMPPASAAQLTAQEVEKIANW